MDDLIYLEDDADPYGDEPKPKADVMTITDTDAVALHEFVCHVNIRCYDERSPACSDQDYSQADMERHKTLGASDA
ncbi:hypothetical protein [Rhizobium lusitanum]|uniref:hypothetical protein n=1 Tax=Rhizobium lusitanum TaxID=293958 RepID=UPI001956174F|nr:hypothetical protein [Rhizobium lusitanum]MBM7048369.1 hypothetical protein [Rhizobium lusitanum]